MAPGPGGALWGDALRAVRLRGSEWAQPPWPWPSRVAERWGPGADVGVDSELLKKKTRVCRYWEYFLAEEGLRKDPL